MTATIKAWGSHNQPPKTGHIVGNQRRVRPGLDLDSARNQRGKIAALVAVERNNVICTKFDVRFRLYSVGRAVRVFNDGLASVAVVKG
jgi:hypothetical protein